jgi:hypothetical protein
MSDRASKALAEVPRAGRASNMRCQIKIAFAKVSTGAESQHLVGTYKFLSLIYSKMSSIGAEVRNS